MNSKKEWEHLIEKQKSINQWKTTGLVTATAIVAIIISLVALCFNIYSYVHIKYVESGQRFQISGEVQPTPYTAYLDSTAAPIAMTLPNDLTPYIGVERSIISRTAQPHTVTIAAGPLSTTWDGVNTVATFGGAIGDAIHFRVIDASHIVVWVPKNVAFS